MSVGLSFAQKLCPGLPFVPAQVGRPGPLIRVSRVAPLAGAIMWEPLAETQKTGGKRRSGLSSKSPSASPLHS